MTDSPDAYPQYLEVPLVSDSRWIAATQRIADAIKLTSELSTENWTGKAADAYNQWIDELRHRLLTLSALCWTVQNRTEIHRRKIADEVASLGGKLG
jgi:uncharacterized protein YukE